MVTEFCFQGANDITLLISTISLRSLRQQMGVVDQDTFLFGGTIRQNLSVGHPEATLDEIIEAAQQAGAHQFIKEMPAGYESQIGEGGGMLSGGQRQRVAIATRAQEQQNKAQE